MDNPALLIAIGGGLLVVLIAYVADRSNKRKKK